MQCSNVDNLLSAYLDGELSDQDRAAVEAHVRDCPSCASLLRSLKAASAMVSSLPRRTAPPDFAAGVLRRIEEVTGGAEAAPVPAPVRHRPKLVYLIPRYAAAAVVLLAVGAVGYVTLTGYQWRPIAPVPPAPLDGGDEGLAMAPRMMEPNDGSAGEAGRYGMAEKDRDGRRLDEGRGAVRGRLTKRSRGAAARPSPPTKAEEDLAFLEKQIGRKKAGELLDLYARQLDPGGRERAAEVGREVGMADGKLRAPELNAASVRFDVVARTMAKGRSAVGDIVDRHGWASRADNGKSDAKADGGGLYAVTFAVPEGQMGTLLKALASSPDLSVRNLDIGRTTALTDETKVATLRTGRDPAPSHGEAGASGRAFGLGRPADKRALSEEERGSAKGRDATPQTGAASRDRQNALAATEEQRQPGGGGRKTTGPAEPEPEPSMRPTTGGPGVPPRKGRAGEPTSGLTRAHRTVARRDVEPTAEAGVRDEPGDRVEHDTAKVAETTAAAGPASGAQGGQGGSGGKWRSPAPPNTVPPCPVEGKPTSRQARAVGRAGSGHPLPKSVPKPADDADDAVKECREGHAKKSADNEKLKTAADIAAAPRDSLRMKDLETARRREGGAAPGSEPAPEPEALRRPMVFHVTIVIRRAAEAAAPAAER